MIKKHTCYIAPQSSCCLKKVSQKNDDTQHVPCIEGEQKDIIGKLFQFFSSFLTHFYRDAFTQSCEYDTDCLIGSHDCSKEQICDDKQHIHHIQKTQLGNNNACICVPGGSLGASCQGWQKRMMMMIIFSFYLDLSELRSDMRSMQFEVLYVATENKFRPKIF